MVNLTDLESNTENLDLDIGSYPGNFEWQRWVIRIQGRTSVGGFLWLLLGVMYGSHFLIESRVRNQPLRSANISYRLARTTPTPLDCYFLVRGLFN